jgi:hypothetical protein
MRRFFPARCFFPAVLLACGGEVTPTSTSVSHLEIGPNWVQKIAENPTAFGDLTQEGRKHWIALHSGDYKSILKDDSVAPALKFRAHAALAALYFRMARISRFAWQETLTTWADTQSGGLPQALQFVPESAALSGWTKLLADQAPQGRVVDLIASVQAEPDRLIAMAQKPLPDTQDGPIRLYNPLVYQSLYENHLHQLAIPETADLGYVIFSSCPDGLATDRPTFAPLGCFDTRLLTGLPNLDLELGDTDDAQVAREFVRALDDQLIAWEQALSAKAPEAGQALLSDLNLVGIYRSQSLIGLAEKALQRDRPRQALALAQMAQDMAHPRAIGPLNPPVLFAILAEANVLTGHTREALDSLQVLTDAYPETVALDETVGDLAVLKGLNRQGDSKEL